MLISLPNIILAFTTFCVYPDRLDRPFFRTIYFNQIYCKDEREGS